MAYLGGFSAVHTGNMVAAAGRKYHEVRMTEGPDIGKTKVIPQEKDLQADAEAKRKQWQEQQAAFSRLDASQAKPQPTPPAAANPTPSAPANDEPAFSLSNPKPKPKPMEFENLGGKQGALFGKSGLAGQMNLFADKGVPDSMVAKPQAQPSAERDRGDFSQVKPPEPKPSLTPEQEKVAAGKGGIPKPSGETAKSVAAKHDAEIEHLKALTALAKVGIDARKLDRGQAVDMAKRLAAGQGGGEPEAKPPEPKQGKPKAKKPGKVRDRGAEEDAKSDAEEAAYNKQQRQATEADRKAGKPAPGPIPSHELPQHLANAFANHGRLTGSGGADYGPNNANNRALMESDAKEAAALKAMQRKNSISPPANAATPAAEQNISGNDFANVKPGEKESAALSAGDMFTMPQSHTAAEFKAALVDHGDKFGIVNAATGNGALGSITKIPKSQFPRFLDDLRGVVRGKPSGNASVNAVLNGSAKFLGRGNEGLGFDAGDGNVVKVSSDVPFHWNNGVRPEGEQARTAAAQAEANEKLRTSGVPGLLPQTSVSHEGRTHIVMPKVDTESPLKQEHIEQLAETVKELHSRGYSIGDEIQAGIGKDGKAYIYDTGAIKKAGRFDEEDDRGRLSRLADKHGLQFKSSNPQGEYEDALERSLKGAEGEGPGLRRLRAKALQAAFDALPEDLRDWYSDGHAETMANLKK